MTGPVKSTTDSPVIGTPSGATATDRTPVKGRGFSPIDESGAPGNATPLLDSPAGILPDLDPKAVGDGRNAATREYLDAYGHHTIAEALKVWPGGAEAYEAVRARVAETRDRNPRPETDFRGDKVTLGNTVTLTPRAGAERVLVGESLFPAGQSARAFELSPDGKKIAVGFAGKSDLQTWKVIDIATQTEVIPAVQFNSFGESRVKFMPDSDAVVYPSLDEDVKAARSLIFQSLPSPGGAPKPPETIFAGESVLPHIAHVIDRNTVLAEATLQIAETPGFPNFTALVTRGEESSWAASQDRVLPAGADGRVVTADQSEIVYQTAIDHENRALVSVDPLTGRRRDLVPAKADEVLHVVDRVGDLYCAFYLSDTPDCAATDKTWRLRLFDKTGGELRTVEMAELGLPPRLDVPLSFSGGRDSTKTEFTLGEVGVPAKTFSLDVARIEEMVAQKQDVAKAPIESLLTERASEAVDFDPSKVGRHFEQVVDKNGNVNTIEYRWAKVRPEGRYDSFEDLPKDAVVKGYAYGSIGIVRTPNNEPGYRDLIERGVVIPYITIPGGGARGTESRDAGALDRDQTIDALEAVGERLRQHFPEGFIGLEGRSWGGWLVENVMARAAESAEKLFDYYVSIVSAGESDSLIASFFQRWGLHDFGALMGRRGQVDPDQRDYAIEQATRTSTPRLFQKLSKAVKSFFSVRQKEAAGDVIFAVEKNDDRAPPGSIAKSAFHLTNWLGFGERVNVITGDGGHGSRSHADEMALVLNRVLVANGRQLGESHPLRREVN